MRALAAVLIFRHAKQTYLEKYFKYDPSMMEVQPPAQTPSLQDIQCHCTGTTLFIFMFHFEIIILKSIMSRCRPDLEQTPLHSA